jgi:hypothetical protein
MNFWNKICGLIAIFFISFSFVSAQERTLDKRFAPQFSHNQLVSSVNLFLNRDNTSLVKYSSAIPENFYTQHFGVMCKQELAIEKATKIPIRFRLGSLQQCNYLEGKK